MNSPHMEFTADYQNVTIICHAHSNRTLVLSSVKIHKGCSVRNEYLTLCHSRINVTDGGSACLFNCNVGLNSPPVDLPTTFLCFGKHTDLGTVTFQECSLSPTIQKKIKPSFFFQSKQSPHTIFDRWDIQ
jgi:hypothetical protein